MCLNAVYKAVNVDCKKGNNQAIKALHYQVLKGQKNHFHIMNKLISVKNLKIICK